MRLYRIRRSPSDWTAQARRSHSHRMVVRRVLTNRPDRRVNQSVLVLQNCRGGLMTARDVLVSLLWAVIDSYRPPLQFHCRRRVSLECKFLVGEQEIDGRQHEHCEEGRRDQSADNNNREGFLGLRSDAMG